MERLDIKSTSQDQSVLSSRESVDKIFRYFSSAGGDISYHGVTNFSVLNVLTKRGVVGAAKTVDSELAAGYDGFELDDAVDAGGRYGYNKGYRKSLIAFPLIDREREGGPEVWKLFLVQTEPKDGKTIGHCFLVDPSCKEDGESTYFKEKIFPRLGDELKKFLGIDESTVCNLRRCAPELEEGREVAPEESALIICAAFRNACVSAINFTEWVSKPDVAHSFDDYIALERSRNESYLRAAPKASEHYFSSFNVVFEPDKFLKYQRFDNVRAEHLDEEVLTSTSVDLVASAGAGGNEAPSEVDADAATAFDETSLVTDPKTHEVVVVDSGKDDAADLLISEFIEEENIKNRDRLKDELAKEKSVDETVNDFLAEVEAAAQNPSTATQAKQVAKADEVRGAAVVTKGPRV